MRTYDEKDVNGMVPDPALVSKTFQHVEQETHYKVIGISFNCTSDTWDYLYQQLDGKGPIYNRSTVNFNARFKKVEKVYG